MRAAAAGNVLLLGALLGLVAVASGCRSGGDEGTVPELISPEGTVPPVLAEEFALNLDTIQQTVVDISTEIGERVAGTEKLRETATYAESYVDALGYEAEMTDYELPNGKTGHNVIASTPADGPRLVLAAHMDTVRDCPCANDDATGMAVILDIARLLREEKLDGEIPVQFVFLGAEEALEDHEEHGFSAVEFLEQLPGDEADRIAAAVWLDKLGRGPRFLAMYISGTSDAAAGMFVEATEGEDPQPEIVAARRWSEDMAFEDRGIPTAWVEWGKDPHLHQPTDVADTVDWGKVGTVADATLRMVLQKGWIPEG